MIIFVRHGERSDQVYGQKQEKIIKDYDPHLTEKGEFQARVTGAKLCEILKNYAQQKQLKVEDLQINFMTSPFLRCIQTSINLMKEIPNNSTLHIQDEIAEWMADFLFKKECQQKLHIRTDQHPKINKEFLKGIQIVNKKFIDHNEFIQAKFPENQDRCNQRVQIFLRELINHMKKLPNKQNIINICVTHQGLVQFALQNFKTNFGYVDYCGVAQLILDENNEIKVGLKGQSLWK